MNNGAHNAIQRGCSGEDGPELAVGQLYGLRQWLFRPTSGQLVGHQDRPWHLDEENVGVCLAFVRSELFRVVVIGSDYEDAYTKGVTAVFEAGYVLSITDAGCGPGVRYADAALPHDGSDIEATLPSGVKLFSSHSAKEGTIRVHFTFDVILPVNCSGVADPRCTCGYYAYHSVPALTKNSIHLSTYTVFGLVAGYGRVTLGTLGFRAERSRVLALTADNPPGFLEESNRAAHVFVYPGAFRNVDYPSPARSRSETVAFLDELARTTPDVKIFSTFGELMDFADPLLEETRKNLEE